MISWTVPATVTSTATSTATAGQYTGYATGSDVHASATTLADIEEAFSGAAVNSQGLSGDVVDTDLADQPLVQAADAGANAGARGSGVEAGVAPPPPLTDQIILSQLATATAAPDSGLVTKQIPLSLTPLLNASVLKGTAQAHWSTGGCVLGAPISEGTGEATNLGLLGTSSIDPLGVIGSPGAASSTSNEVLVPQVDKNGNQVGDATGLMSQVVETVAPLQIANVLTVTVVGPWELQAVALGTAGSYLGYGPAPSPQQAGILNGTIPAVTIAGLGGVTITTVSFQQLLSPKGFTLPLGVATVSIAAPPRAIGGAPGSAPTVTDQSVSAAADLIQVSVGGPENIAGNQGGSGNLADVRVGHMVASASVGAGGLHCPIPVAKTASQTNVHPGDRFSYSINLSNPYGCPLNNLKVVDTTGASGGVSFAIPGEDPPADANRGGVLTWSHLASLAPGVSEVLTVNVAISSSSGAGTLTEAAKVTGSCGVGDVQGTATISLPLAGAVTINLPTISSGVGAALPVTGGPDGRYYAVALLLALAAVGFGRRAILAMLKSARP